MRVARTQIKYKRFMLNSQAHFACQHDTLGHKKAEGRAHTNGFIIIWCPYDTLRHVKETKNFSFYF